MFKNSSQLSIRLPVHLYIVTSEIAQVVEHLRRMQEIAGSNRYKTFFNNSFVLLVYLLFFYIKLYVYIKINLFVK